MGCGSSKNADAAESTEMARPAQKHTGSNVSPAQGHAPGQQDHGATEKAPRNATNPIVYFDVAIGGKSPAPMIAT